MIIKDKAIKYGDNVDTDVIIPARYLNTFDEKELAAHCFEDLDDSFKEKIKDSKIVIAGDNFGCGSSREHAPACLEIAGVEAVVAESFARIFYRNSVDGGFFIPFETEVSVYQEIETGDELRIDVEAGTLENKTKNKTYKLKPLGDVADIIEAGDIFQYAKKAGLIKT